MNLGDGHDYEEWFISGQHYMKCRRCGAILGRDGIMCRTISVQRPPGHKSAEMKLHKQKGEPA